MSTVLTQPSRYRGVDVEITASLRDDGTTEIEIVTFDEGEHVRAGWCKHHVTGADLWLLSRALEHGPTAVDWVHWDLDEAQDAA